MKGLRTVAGEGRTARGALEALAHGLKDLEVDELGTMTITLQRSTVRELGKDTTFEGFRAEVVR